jgi:hypothetical protein
MISSLRLPLYHNEKLTNLRCLSIGHFFWYITQQTSLVTVFHSGVLGISRHCSVCLLNVAYSQIVSAPQRATHSLSVFTPRIGRDGVCPITLAPCVLLKVQKLKAVGRSGSTPDSEMTSSILEIGPGISIYRYIHSPCPRTV